MKDFITKAVWKNTNIQAIWHQTSQLDSRSFDCGNCGAPLSADDGYYANVVNSPNNDNKRVWSILICHHCAHPTFFGDDDQIPGPQHGNIVEHLPGDVGNLYDEARGCCGVNAFTAAVLCCRKLLMNIAVSKGAKEGKSFIEYVKFLADKGFVPPDGKGWVDHIRQKGNEATHEIAIIEKEDAHMLISFSEMLLKFIFEFPAKISTSLAPAQDTEDNGGATP